MDRDSNSTECNLPGDRCQYRCFVRTLYPRKSPEPRPPRSLGEWLQDTISIPLPIAVQRIVLENQADIRESSFRLLFTPQALLVGSSFLSDASGRKSVLETQRSPCLALVHRLINRFPKSSIKTTRASAHSEHSIRRLNMETLLKAQTPAEDTARQKSADFTRPSPRILDRSRQTAQPPKSANTVPPTGGATAESSSEQPGPATTAGSCGSLGGVENGSSGPASAASAATNEAGQASQGQGSDPHGSQIQGSKDAGDTAGSPPLSTAAQTAEGSPVAHDPDAGSSNGKQSGSPQPTNTNPTPNAAAQTAQPVNAVTTTPNTAATSNHSSGTLGKVKDRTPAPESTTDNGTKSSSSTE
ncbi:uncharacterized protein BO66DRAFT_455334 [Aspergillus aculeatinus CBS 121060]|uniref:Uncharacterized protein n=1 Tax=Aspergillus aculeatinus CBS 121060 TaxID=1448322 RepID=A0ACD1H4A5_9EURO|nr:hypothetical protein BO66DRAFT_455334 [Aspergillus aculeatinus CBS 121060]RAH68289.1 hypothetical protein BO66DRAFT_455334 [Aspergillus aculeatinus CBS 121060]